MNITQNGRTYHVASELELRHLLARLNPPAYAVRQALRDATLAVGRTA
jgi:hypothetical protein